MPTINFTDVEEIQWTKAINPVNNSNYVEGGALTTGNNGSIYIAGYTSGDLDGQTNNGNGDAFLTKFNSNGDKQWTKLLGSRRYDKGSALTTGKDGSIYIAGSTLGDLDGQTNSGNGIYGNAFLTKFNPNGDKQWTRLLGSSGFETIAWALTTGNDGSIYIAGHTSGNLDNQTNSGGRDAFLSKFSTDGTKQWTKLLGSSDFDGGNALTTGNDGSIYIAGYTYDDLDNQTNRGTGTDAFLSKFYPNGDKRWTRLLGSNSFDSGNALTTGLDGSIYIAGYAYGILDGQTYSGNGDAFLSKFNPNGTKVWTKLLGSSSEDRANALTTGQDGTIYVASYTVNNGVFLTKFKPDGTKDWTKLLRSNSNEPWGWILGLTTGQDGSIYIAGHGLTGREVFLTKFQKKRKISDISVNASDLNVLDGNTSISIDASAVTTITGSIADVNTAYASNGISDLGNEDVILTDNIRSVPAGILNTLDSNTSGLINASSLTSITGPTSDIDAVYSSNEFIGLPSRSSQPTRIQVTPTIVTKTFAREKLNQIKQDSTSSEGPMVVARTVLDNVPE